MNEEITAEEIASTVELLRDEFRGAVVLVEGATDSLFFEKFVDQETCQTIVCYGRKNVIDALTLVEGLGIDGVVAVADSDFDRVLPEIAVRPTSSNLFFTDTHDVETMMLSSPALAVVLRERGETRKVNVFTQRRGKTVESALIEAAKPIAVLRLMSIADKLALTFKDINHAKFVDAKTLVTDVRALVCTVKAYSNRLDLKDDEIVSKISMLLATERDPWQLCSGHDMTAVLGIGLHTALGTHDKKQVSPDVVESYLRMAYDFTYLMATSLYDAICRWEESSGYSVFRKLPPRGGTQEIAS